VFQGAGGASATVPVASLARVGPDAPVPGLVLEADVAKGGPTVQSTWSMSGPASWPAVRLALQQPQPWGISSTLRDRYCTVYCTVLLYRTVHPYAIVHPYTVVLYCSDIVVLHCTPV